MSLAVWAASMGAPAEWSQRRVLDFTLVNGTRSIVMELYVAPASTGVWGSDILGRDLVLPGEELPVSFSRSQPTCLWDVKIVDEDNNKLPLGRFNLCEASSITLTSAKGKPTAIVK